ncbi:MAG: TatD family hydrolase, partial [Patescibacteria group bacterium]
TAQRYLEMGFYLSFNGIITYANDYDKVVKNMPLERLLLETDCPYLAPAPLRGQRNEPAHVKYVAQRVAEIRGEPVEKIAAITTQNARDLFVL